MKLDEQITEEMRRFNAFYGHEPDFVYLGQEQAAQFDLMIKYLMLFGFTVTAPQATPTFMGMKVYRVDQARHLSFGLDQPSPCG